MMTCAGLDKSERIEKLLIDLDEQKILKNDKIKPKHKKIFAKNKQIMLDTTTKLKELCKMIEHNVKLFENQNGSQISSNESGENSNNHFSPQRVQTDYVVSLIGDKGNEIIDSINQKEEILDQMGSDMLRSEVESFSSNQVNTYQLEKTASEVQRDLNLDNGYLEEEKD